MEIEKTGAEFTPEETERLAEHRRKKAEQHKAWRKRQKAGTIVIGAVAASWITITTSFEMLNDDGSPIIELQKTLDGICPKLLSVITVIFCWWLMSKKKISPTLVMLILVVIAFAGVLLGFFDPKLSY